MEQGKNAPDAGFMNERTDKTAHASRVAGHTTWLAYLVEANWPRAVAAACGMALLLSATTALGTASLPFFGRTAYWLMEMLLGAGAIGAILWLLRHLPRRRLYLRTAIVALVGAPLITIAVWATTEPINGRALQWERIPAYLPGVLAVVGFNAFMQIMLGRRDLEQGGSPLTSPTPEHHKGSDPTVYALEAQAHYVVFHTTAGATRKLVRFYDAIASVADSTPGLQIHRSWWVARSAVLRFEEKTRSVRLVNDLHLPVSRTHLAAARATFDTCNIAHGKIADCGSQPRH